MMGRRTLLLAAGVALGAVAAKRMTAQRRRFELRGKVVVITGGSRGLGLVLAREMARRGARIAICARDALALATARAELEARGAEVLAIPCDVTNRVDVDAMLAEVRRQLGPVDVLINNAGVIQVGPMEAMTPEDYDRALRVHFWGPLYTTLGVLPDMRRRGSGRIVNIASFGGKISVPHLLPYCTSKFALAGFSEGLRSALAGEGIYVTTVCPGLMRTGSHRNAWFKGQHRREFAWFSIGGSLPLISIAATRAAQRIVEACCHGTPEIVLPGSMAAVVKLHALFPGAGAGLLRFVDRVLPNPGGIETSTRRGAESESWLAPSLLTTLNDRAAAANNELTQQG